MKETIIEVPLNVIVDKPNLNKRIYSKEIINKIIDTAKNKKMPLMLNFNLNQHPQPTVDWKNIVGFVDDIYVNYNDQLIINANISKKDVFEMLKHGIATITTKGYGHYIFITTHEYYVANKNKKEALEKTDWFRYMTDKRYQIVRGDFELIGFDVIKNK